MKKLYRVLMIVLPIFVGSASLVNLIFYLSNQKTFMSLIFSIIFFFLAYAVGIKNILDIFKEMD
ncbi:hypothetical protein [Peptostreptococcus sp.]|jgi:hypothetical protein|uniref:hypothetical protein n=1 Tax=Peptostreptococcus sp. TaxID=1262 RepID=UPI003995333A